MFWAAIIIKPFVALIMFGVICLGARILVQRFMPECSLKRLLLKTVIKDGSNGSRW